MRLKPAYIVIILTLVLSAYFWEKLFMVKTYISNTADTKVDYDSKGTVDVATKTINALKNNDYERLAELTHPTKGLQFSPNAYVTKDQIVLSDYEVRNLASNEKVYTWGFHDGSGNPITLKFTDYFKSFIWDRDFSAATEVTINVDNRRGNTINNSLDYFPNGYVIEYYLPGENPEYGGMDWTSLRLVLEQHNGEWKLVAIIHDEWTI